MKYVIFDKNPNAEYKYHGVGSDWECSIKECELFHDKDLASKKLKEIINLDFCDDEKTTYVLRRVFPKNRIKVCLDKEELDQFMSEMQSGVGDIVCDVALENNLGLSEDQLEFLTKKCVKSVKETLDTYLVSSKTSTKSCKNKKVVIDGVTYRLVEEK